MIQKERHYSKPDTAILAEGGICDSNPALKEKYSSLLKEVGKLRGKPLLYPYLGSGRGRGVYVELLDGSVKMDLIGGAGVHILGHSHPALIQQARQAAEANVVTQGHLAMNREYLQISQKLVELASRHSRLSHVWLCGSGSMANENALKMIRQRHYFKHGKGGKFWHLTGLLRGER